MLIYRGGHKAGKGTYWDVWNGHRIDVTQEGMMLPGCDGSKYLRMQPGLMLLVATAVGMLYAFLFPFIGMAVVLTAVTRKVLESVVGLVGTSLSFHWNPKNVYLTGRKRRSERGKVTR